MERRRVAQHVDHAGHLVSRLCRDRRRFRRVGDKVHQLGEQLHPADPVGERVVDLHDGGRLPVLETLDRRPGPQRPGRVEVAHPLGPGEVEDAGERGRACAPDPAHVPGEVEVGVDDPKRSCHPHRWFDETVPQAGNDVARPLEAGEHAIRVG